MNILLIIHNFGYLGCILLSGVLGLFILAHGWNKKPNILYFLTAYTYIFYCVSYLLAVNLTDAYAAQMAAHFMMITMAIVAVNAHLAFSVFGLEAKHKKFLIAMYSSGIAIFLFYMQDISRFSGPLTSAAYFAHFPQGGPYYFLFEIFVFWVIIYFLATLILLYRKADPVEKNRLKYFILAFVWGYGFSIPAFMNISGFRQIDMVVTVFIGLYTIPLGYGVFRYNLIDIRIAAKNAAIYILYTVFFGALITGVNILNNYILVHDYNFPIWILPGISGIFIMIAGLLMWRKIREADLLKYEFINNISHKFRTPLTHIRWLAEDLREMETQEERNKAVEQIQFASMRLFELTNIVMDASQSTSQFYLYHFTNVDLAQLISEIDKAHKDQMEQKRLQLHIDVGPDVLHVKADKARLQFALQILFENSLIYTPVGGLMDIKVRQIGDEIIITFKDNGIGIREEDIPYLFSKFYRSTNARHADTEGMGIGLYMAKTIVEKHNGRIWAESKGENQGSKFSIALPIE